MQQTRLLLIAARCCSPDMSDAGGNAAAGAGAPGGTGGRGTGSDNNDTGNSQGGTLDDIRDATVRNDNNQTMIDYQDLRGRDVIGNTEEDEPMTGSPSGRGNAPLDTDQIGRATTGDYDAGSIGASHPDVPEDWAPDEDEDDRYMFDGDPNLPS